jgi:hypothetical protein
MTIAYLPTAAERVWIIRASAHATPDHLLTEDARWAHRDVDDETVARVMLALERGTEIRCSPHGRWYAPAGSPLNGQSLSHAVREMVRTGLLIHHHTGALVPANVHLMVWTDELWASACATPGENMGPKRTRLVAEHVAVDCLACLDRL